LSKIDRTNLTDKIFDYIKSQIRSGEWTPNMKLPSEIELAETLGVSRMSLRMAIQKSNVIGLTETRVGEGTFVRDFSMRSYFSELYSAKILSKDYNTINDFRMILQIGSIRLAFEKDTFDSDVKELEAIYLEMEEAANQNDIERFRDIDSRFHQKICGLADNELMYMLYDAIEYTLNEVSATNVEYSIKKSGSFDNILKFHRTIFEGIKNRQIDTCIEAEMESRERSKKYYEKVSDS